MSCNGKGLIDTLLPNMDAILGVRDSIGAIIKPVYFLTRTWYNDCDHTQASDSPEGFAVDSLIQMLPTPKLKDFSQDERLKEGGSVKNGDLILSSISKTKYVESDLDGSSNLANVEKLFVVGTKVYQVINVTEKYVTFNVQIRELSKQARY